MNKQLKELRGFTNIILKMILKMNVFKFFQVKTI